MGLCLRNGDYVPDHHGGLRRAEGQEALLERVLFRLAARRGTFPFLPALGSRLWKLGQVPGAERQSAAMGIPCPPVRLTEARGRWGSCSPGGVIRLSWRLLLCPPPVLEHVVIHELCHLRHRDHGPEFHRAVAARDPAWREARRWLRENRGIMELL